MREPPTETLRFVRCHKCNNTTATHSRHDWRPLNEQEARVFEMLLRETRPTMIGRRRVECECGLKEDYPEFFVP